MVSYRKTLFGGQTITDASDGNSSQESQSGSANIFGGAPRQSEPAPQVSTFADLQDAGRARPAPPMDATPSAGNPGDEEELLRRIRAQLAQGGTTAQVSNETTPAVAPPPVSSVPASTASFVAGPAASPLVDQVSASLASGKTDAVVPAPEASVVNADVSPVAAPPASSVSATPGSDVTSAQSPELGEADTYDPEFENYYAKVAASDAAAGKPVPTKQGTAAFLLTNATGWGLDRFGFDATTTIRTLRDTSAAARSIGGNSTKAVIEGLQSSNPGLKAYAEHQVLEGGFDAKQLPDDLRAEARAAFLKKYATTPSAADQWEQNIERPLRVQKQEASLPYKAVRRLAGLIDENGKFSVPSGKAGLNGFFAGDGGTAVEGNVSNPEDLKRLMAYADANPGTRAYGNSSGGGTPDAGVNSNFTAQVEAAIAAAQKQQGQGGTPQGSNVSDPTATGTAQSGLYSALEQRVMDALNGPGRYNDATIAKLRAQQTSELEADFATKLKQEQDFIAQRGLAASTIGVNKQSMLQGQQARARAQMETDLMTKVADAMAQDKQNAVANALGLRGQMSSESQFERTMGLNERQFAAQSDQFAQSFGLDKAKFAEASQQFRMTLAQNAQQFGVQQAFNEKTFNQQASQFAQSFGLDQQKFMEASRQFQQGLNQSASQFAASQAQNASQFGQTAAQRQQEIDNQKNQWQVDSDQRNRAFILDVLNKLPANMTDAQKKAIYALFGIPWTSVSSSSGSSGGTTVPWADDPNNPANADKRSGE